jgi:uncharacterized protein YqgC (DUF456 family)
MTPTEVLLALVVAVGLAGVVVPVLPGSALVALAVLVWAITTGGSTAWAVLAVALSLLAAGAVVKYVVPGRRLQAVGVPTRSLVAGGVLAVVGFFVLPVVGLVVGFLLGVLLAEWQRLGDPGAARRSTWHAARAVGLGMLIELCAGLAAAAVWVVGVFAT